MLSIWVNHAHCSHVTGPFNDSLLQISILSESIGKSILIVSSD